MFKNKFQTKWAVWVCGVSASCNTWYSYLKKEKKKKQTKSANGAKWLKLLLTVTFEPKIQLPFNSKEKAAKHTYTHVFTIFKHTTPLVTYFFFGLTTEGGKNRMHKFNTFVTTATIHHVIHMSKWIRGDESCMHSSLSPSLSHSLSLSLVVLREP